MEIPPQKFEPPTLGIVNDDLTITFKRDLSFCHHPAVVVDAAARTVHCGRCKRTLDPFDALGNLARDSTSLVEERAALKEDIKRWRKDHEEARRQRANAIAARKRAENPEATLLREMVQHHEFGYCNERRQGRAACGRCFLCRVRILTGAEL